MYRRGKGWLKHHNRIRILEASQAMLVWHIRNRGSGDSPRRFKEYGHQDERLSQGAGNALSVNIGTSEIFR